MRFLLGIGLAAVFSGAPAGLDAQQTGDVLITGSTVVDQGEPPRVLDILFSRQDRGLVVEGISHPGILQATDTIDLSGSYLHTANTMSAGRPFEVGGSAMYVVRTGPSQGHAARMVILPSRMHLVESTSNFPEGPVHEAAGCYSVEHGPWDRPASQQAEERFSVPEAIQIHWQYLLHHGRENSLAATDGEGRVPEGANFFAWSPMGGDSIRIHLQDNHVGLTFRLLREENGYAGTVSRWVHTGDASAWSKASIGLVPTSCIVSYQGSEAGTPQGVDRAAAAALGYLLDQGHVEAPIRLGLNSASERANPQVAARTLEATAAVASRLGIPFDDHEVFRQPICDDVGKEGVGGDGCRWLLPGHPVALTLPPAVEGERGLRLGLSIWGVLSRAVVLRGQEHPQGWSRHYTLRVSQEDGGAYNVEILNVVYGSW